MLVEDLIKELQKMPKDATIKIAELGEDDTEYLADMTYVNIKEAGTLVVLS